MPERVELTGNVWLSDAERGVYRLPDAKPVDLGAPTSYAIKDIDLSTGLQTCSVYGPDGVLLEVWHKMGEGQWTKVAE